MQYKTGLCLFIAAAISLAMAESHLDFAYPRVDVDLAKSPWYREKQRVGQKVSDVLNPLDIEKIILTRAVTTAMPDIDVSNIRGLLGTKARFEPFTGESVDHGLPNPTWEALITTKRGQFYLFQANHEWGCLVDAEGHGFWKVESPAQKRMQEPSAAPR